MQTKKLWRVIVTTSTALALTVPAFAQIQDESLDAPRPSDSSSSGVASLQVSDRNGESVMKDEASTEADQRLNQHIRQALKEDTALADAAQSVFIVTDNGEVTLHGSVATEKEKADINAKVHQVAGVKKLKNQLQMSPPDLRGSASDSMNTSDNMTLSARSSKESSSDTVTQ